MKVTKSLQIDRNIHQRLRIFCALHDMKINDVVEESVQQFLNTKEKK